MAEMAKKHLCLLIAKAFSKHFYSFMIQGFNVGSLFAFKFQLFWK